MPNRSLRNHLMMRKLTPHLIYRPSMVLNTSTTKTHQHEKDSDSVENSNATHSSPKLQHESRNGEEKRSGDHSSLAGLSKAYMGRNKFSGTWEENLDGSIRLYEALSKLCKLGED